MDDRDYLKITQDLARQRTGRDLTDDEIAANFSLYGLEKRSQILDRIETESVQGAISDDGHSLREAGRRMRTVQALRNAHARLRAVGR